MSARPTVCLLIPCLNEAAALPHILAQIDTRWVDEILFVDGNSTDNTVEVIKAWGHGEVFSQKERGLSNAYWEAFPRIRSEVVITFSPDGNSLPEAIPRLIEKISEGYDMVVASRYLGDAKSDDDGPVTGFGNWMFTTMVNVLYGAKITDSLVMYRAYRRSLIEEIGMDTHEPAFEPQLSVLCALHKKRVAEIPAREPKRIGGDRKMRIFVNGMACLKIVLGEWFRRGERLRRSPRTSERSS